MIAPYILSRFPIPWLADYCINRAQSILVKNNQNTQGFEYIKFMYHAKLAARVYKNLGNNIDERNAHRLTYWVKEGEMLDENIPMLSYLFYF